MRLFILAVVTTVSINASGATPHGGGLGVKILRQKVVSQVKRLIMRHSVNEGKASKIATMGMVATLLLSNVSIGQEKFYKWFGVEEFASLYGGWGRDFLPESSGAYVTEINGVSYQRFGDYYGKPTDITETISTGVVGAGIQLRKGVELKILFHTDESYEIKGASRSTAPEVWWTREQMYDADKDPYLSGARDKLHPYLSRAREGGVGIGRDPSYILSITHQIFGVDGDGLSWFTANTAAPFTFSLGPSLNRRHVYNTASARLYRTYPYLAHPDMGKAKGEFDVGILWQTNLRLFGRNSLLTDLSHGLIAPTISLVYVGSVTRSGATANFGLVRIGL